MAQKMAAQNPDRRKHDMTATRQETYGQLIALGHTPAEAWALMEQIDFAEDYN